MRTPTAAMAAALGVLATCLLAASSSSAHGGDPDYRSEIGSIHPAIEGLSAEIENFDSDLRFTNRSGETVLIKGYEREPYLRFEPDGLVFINENSPAAYLNADRYGRVDVPDGIDPRDPPAWKQVADGGEFAWHDHRSHYMGEGVPEVVTDEDARTKVFDYSIPIEVGGQPGAIDGTLYWVGQPSDAPVLPFVVLGIVTVLLVAVVIAVRRRRGSDDAGSPEDEAW